jgi:pseudouridine-5'-phosphate glycosidase
MEVRQREATPATIAVLDGSVHVGINADELERLSKGENVRKVSTRDFAPAVVNGWSGGTTVAATLQAAHTVGIRVFATGGIGGVHRQPTFDISADLTQLARTPMVVVCAGAKAILDLPATLEYLETAAIPVVGYQTDEFPAFYSQLSGLKTSVRADSAEIAAEIARAHWDLGMQSAILVAVPPPRDAALPNEMMDDAIKQALQDAERRGVRGQAVTPFLLQRVSDLTGGASLRANLALLRNNARVAAEIACHLTPKAKQFSI